MLLDVDFESPDGAPAAGGADVQRRLVEVTLEGHPDEVLSLHPVWSRESPRGGRWRGRK